MLILVKSSIYNGLYMISMQEMYTCGPGLEVNKLARKLFCGPVTWVIYLFQNFFNKMDIFLNFYTN